MVKPLRNIRARTGYTILEILTVIAIISVLLAIALPAIHKARCAANRIQCSNQVRQLGLALIRFHDEHGSLPMGTTLDGNMDFPYMTWLTRLLPFIEQDALWQRTIADYQVQRSPFRPVPHANLAATVKLFSCPADPRGPGPHWANRNRLVGVTSFTGVLGTDHLNYNGVLYRSSNTRFSDISDGASNTLMVGERPPSADYWFGWWYAGVGMADSGSPDFLLGVRELRASAPFTDGCEAGPYHFQPGRLTNQCDVFHFWSLHPGGANFVMCDGSVHFLSYSADAVLPALATRAGNEAVEVP